MTLPVKTIKMVLISKQEKCLSTSSLKSSMIPIRRFFSKNSSCVLRGDYHPRLGLKEAIVKMKQDLLYSKLCPCQTSASKNISLVQRDKCKITLINSCLSHLLLIYEARKNVRYFYNRLNRRELHNNK